MATVKISGYTFSTTSVPTSPALKVVSGTDTYYVNLTTGQRPAALSAQKVFTVSTSNYSFLRPYVTSNSRTGYSGVSNNSTSTTGYSGVSNNSTSTTGYAGVSSSSLKGQIADYYGGGTFSYSFVPTANYFNQTSLSGMTNWTTTSTKANSGSHSISKTVTTGYTGISGSSSYGNSAIDKVSDSLSKYAATMNAYSIQGFTNWTTSSSKQSATNSTNTKATTSSITKTYYDSLTYTRKEYRKLIRGNYTQTSIGLSSANMFGPFYWIYSNFGQLYFSSSYAPVSKNITVSDRLPLLFTCSAGSASTWSSTISSYMSSRGSLVMYYVYAGGPDFTFTVTKGTQSTASTYYGTYKISRSGSKFTISGTPSNYQFAFYYGFSKTYTSPTGTGTLSFPLCSDLLYTVEAASSNGSITLDVIERGALQGTIPYGTASNYILSYNTSIATLPASVPFTMSNTTGSTKDSFTRTSFSYGTITSNSISEYWTESSSGTHTSYVTDSVNSTITTTSYYTLYSGTLTASSSKSYYSSSAAVGKLTSTTALTKTDSTSMQHWSMYATNTASSGKTYSSSSTVIANLSSTTGLTQTTTRYSSSVSVANLSSTTGLTKTTTRYSSSTAIANLSSTTGLSKITNV